MRDQGERDRAISKLHDDLYAWVKDYVKSDEHSYTLTNILHYIALKHSKKTFVIGIVLGAVGMLILVKWLS